MYSSEGFFIVLARNSYVGGKKSKHLILVIRLKF